MEKFMSAYQGSEKSQTDASLSNEEVEKPGSLWSRLTEENQTPKQAEEYVKMFYDFFKHMSTLSVGSLVLVSTMAEKSTLGHKFTPTLISSLLCFFGSILGSLLAMSQLPRHAAGSKMALRTHNSFLLGGILSAGLFGLALFFLEIHLLS
ncbi:MAG TPA: hypothetical protein VNX00_11400 [Herbaspirillum sp.]|nr:hypothetical protein [Herbaspirillum sp.]